MCAVDLTTADYYNLREKLNSVELLVPFFFFVLKNLFVSFLAIL